MLQKGIYLGLNDIYGILLFHKSNICLLFDPSPNSESANSSTSSLLLQTPNDALFPEDSHLPHHRDHNHDRHHHNNKNTFSALHDDITIINNNHNESDTYPAFSSLEVELSMALEDLPVPPAPVPTKIPNYPYQQESTLTPQRASQVFDFLMTAKKVNKTTTQTQIRNRNKHEERPLPALPLCLSTSSPPSRFSSDSSHESNESNIPPSNDTRTNTNYHIRPTNTEPLQQHEHLNPTSGYNPSPSKEENSVKPIAFSSSVAKNTTTAMENRNISSIASSRGTLYAGPKLHKVAVVSAMEAQANHNLRGPRLLPAVEQYRQNMYKSQDVPKEAPGSNLTHLAMTSAPNLSVSESDDNIDPFILQHPHQYHQHHVPLRSSIDMALTTTQPARNGKKGCIKKKVPVYGVDKENENDQQLRNQEPSSLLHKRHRAQSQLLPMTPVRSRAIFRPPNGMTPSPVSSSDLSPVAQQLMADLRMQRMHARERERKNGRWGSTTSKLKL